MSFDDEKPLRAFSGPGAGETLPQPSVNPFAGDPDLDPDLAPDLTVGGPSSELDAIAAELAANVFDAEVEINVFGRDGWSVVYRTDFGMPDVERLKGKAKDPAFRKSNNGVNPAKHAALLLATMCKRIRRQGVDLELGGQVTTFASADLKAALGLPQGAGAVAAVDALLGGDYRVMRASDELMLAAGVADETDPTN